MSDSEFIKRFEGGKTRTEVIDALGGTSNEGYMQRELPNYVNAGIIEPYEEVDPTDGSVVLKFRPTAKS